MKQAMQYSKDGLHLTEQFEGCKLSAYKPLKTDVWTIGYGHTFKVVEGMVCTQEQADVWLQEDIARSANAVNVLVQVEVNQPEFDALVDFTFNCGITAFRDSTMLRLLNQHQYWKAADEFLKWVNSGGHEVAGLLLRRKAEENLFTSELPKP